MKFETDIIDFRIKLGYCLHGLDINFPAIKSYLAEFTYAEKFLEYHFWRAEWL